MLKLLFAALVIVLSFTAGGHAWIRGAAYTDGGLVINPGGIIYYHNFNVSLNWWKIAGPPTLNSSTNGTLTGINVWLNGTYLDNATGELKTPVPADVNWIQRRVIQPVTYAQYQYQQTSFSGWVGEPFTVTWDGCANPTVSVDTIGSGGTTGTFANNTGSFTLGTGFTIDLRFTMTAACRADPPRNINVYQDRYAANVAAGEFTNPDWRKMVQGFGRIRLMTLNSSNFSGVTDASQMPSDSYPWLFKDFDMAWASGSSSISGTTMTLVGANTSRSPFQIGQTLLAEGLAAGITIVGNSTVNSGLCTPACTGSGTDGTYAISTSATLSSQAILGVPSVGEVQASGATGGINPEQACKIANETGMPIEFAIPVAATDALVTNIATRLKACTSQLVRYSYSNENFNPAFFQYYYCSALSSTVGLGANNPMAYSGYRSAQVFAIVKGVYGTAIGERWTAALGSQFANTGHTSTVISGANAAITAGGLPALTELVEAVDVAPYWGPTLSGNTITGITVSATPTVTITGTNSFTNGQIIKLFVTGGTMAAALNNQYATVSNVSGQTFQIDISTSGLTYGGSLNVAVDGTWFKLADQSATLNAANPSVYPNKFSYFAQQMSKSILTGSASDASYGTLTTPAQANYSSATGAIPDILATHALIASVSGIKIAQYEGANGVQMNPPLQSNPPNQLMEYLDNWQFSSPVVTESTYTIQAIWSATYNAQCGLGTNYAGEVSQFVDSGPLAQYGPFAGLRYIVTPNSDQYNPYWTGVLAANRPCVDPTPAPTATLTYLTSLSTASGSGGTQSFSASYGTAATYAVVTVFSQNAPTVTSVTVDGVALNLDANSTVNNYALIYSGAIPSGAASRTVAINWVGGGFFRRGASAYKIDNLQQASPTSVSTTGSNISAAKNSIIIVQGNCNTGAPTNNYNSSSYAPTATVNDPTALGVGGYWNENVPFSTTKFAITPSATSCPGAVAATYNFLLKRDLDPASNDNSPMWLEKVA